MLYRGRVFTGQMNQPTVKALKESLVDITRCWLTEEASSETLVGDALVGDEEVVSTVSLFNIDAIQIIPETFYYNYQEMLTPPVPAADADKPTNLLVLQYPFQSHQK